MGHNLTKLRRADIILGEGFFSPCLYPGFECLQSKIESKIERHYREVGQYTFRGPTDPASTPMAPTSAVGAIGWATPSHSLTHPLTHPLSLSHSLTLTYSLTQTHWTALSRRGRVAPLDANLHTKGLALLLLFFFTLVTEPGRSLSLKLSDTKFYGP